MTALILILFPQCVLPALRKAIAGGRYALCEVCDESRISSP